MKEQNEQEKDFKKDKKKKTKLAGEKKFYLFTAIGCALALVAIIVVAVAVSAGSEIENTQVNNNHSSSSEMRGEPDSSVGGGDDGGNDEPVVVTPEGMVMPIASVSILNEHGFYHNKTLNSYYEHKGVDFSAEAGTNVLAVEAGVIESIYTGDILTGTEIVIAHGDGLKSVYRFVTQAEGLSVGDSVEKGQVIATVAEANGNEYKDGAHLHFEIVKEGVSVDPSAYLTLEEK